MPRICQYTAEFLNNHNMQMADQAWRTFGVQPCAGKCEWTQGGVIRSGDIVLVQTFIFRRFVALCGAGPIRWEFFEK